MSREAEARARDPERPGTRGALEDALEDLRREVDDELEALLRETALPYFVDFAPHVGIHRAR